jgi:undecaprenyl-diphosphatase
MPGFPNHASRRVLERFTWIAAAILLLGSLAFLGVAGEVMEGDTLRLEERSLMAMRVPGDPSRPVGPAWLEEAFRDFTGLGGVGVLGLLTAATPGLSVAPGAAAGGPVLGPGHRWRSAAQPDTGGALKAGFQRPRPDLISHGSLVHTASFPSGHSTLSAIVHLTGFAMLALVHRRRSVRLYILGCAVLATLLVGLSRVYLGVHWPTDVRAGWAGGAAWVALCWLIARQLQDRGLAGLGRPSDEGGTRSGLCDPPSPRGALSPVSASLSLVPQCLDGVQPGGAAGREVAEDHAHRG